MRTTIARAFERGTIDATQQSAYLSTYSAALSTRRSLSGTRRAELSYVIDTVRRLARKRSLTARLAPMFLILQRNRDWWAKAGPPASGARVQLGGSRVIFQYFPGKGLQLHPLANFGKLNGYWQGRRNADLRSLADDLVKLAVERNGFLAWEYYFAYGGGSPPWISGMAQGTAMQALARAGNRLSDPSLLEVAARARGAFERNTPTGVRVPQSAGNWYALYSFAPRLYVLNGHLQAVNGLRTYAEFAPRTRRRASASTPATSRRRRASRASTRAHGRCTRGRRGSRARRQASTTTRSTATSRATSAAGRERPPTASRPTTSREYLKKDPTVDPYRAVPSPAVAGKGVKFRFKLSKVGRVGIVVRYGGKTYLSTSASFQHGERYIRWVPPRVSNERTYTYTLFAKDLAGQLRVRRRRGAREGRAEAQGALATVGLRPARHPRAREPGRARTRRGPAATAPGAGRAPGGRRRGPRTRARCPDRAARPG